MFAFAAGFNPIDRFNTPLSFIHHPIPGYESKLKISMNRFFNRLSPGQFVTRLNFSIQTHNKFMLMILIKVIIILKVVMFLNC